MLTSDESDESPTRELAGPALAERFPTLHVPMTAEYGPQDVELLRFSLREMFLVTTAAAVMLALFRNMGIFGAVVSFLIAFFFTAAALPRLMPGQTARQCKIFDFVWGAVVPIMCLFFLLQVDFGDFRLVGAFLALQSATMLVVLVAGKSVRRLSLVLAGMLGTGLAIGISLIVVLSLPAIMLTHYYGIGLLFFTPLLTSIAFQRRMRLMMYLGQEIPHPQRGLLVATGIVASLLIPLAVGAVVAILSHFSAAA